MLHTLTRIGFITCWMVLLLPLRWIRLRLIYIYFVSFYRKIVWIIKHTVASHSHRTWECIVFFSLNQIIDDESGSSINSFKNKSNSIVFTLHMWQAIKAFYSWEMATKLISLGVRERERCNSLLSSNRCIPKLLLRFVIKIENTNNQAKIVTLDLKSMSRERRNAVQKITKKMKTLSLCAPKSVKRKIESVEKNWKSHQKNGEIKNESKCWSLSNVLLYVVYV